MVESYESKKRTALWKPVLNRLRQSNDIPLNDKQLQRLNDLEKLYQTAADRNLFDSNEIPASIDIYQKIEKLLLIDSDVDAEINRETFMLLHFIEGDEDQLRLIKQPGDITNQELIERVGKEDADYLEVINSKYYKLANEFIKRLLMWKWSSINNHDHGEITIDRNYFEEIPMIWMYIVSQFHEIDPETITQKDFTEMEGVLDRCLSKKEVRKASYDVNKNKKEFKKLSTELILKYNEVLEKELGYLFYDICIDNYMFDKQSYHEIINHINSNDSLSINDIENFVDKIDDPDVLRMIKTRLEKLKLSLYWFNKLIENHEFENRVKLDSINDDEISFRIIDAVECVLSNTENNIGQRISSYDTLSLEEISKNNFKNVISEGYLYLKIDISSEKDDMKIQCDDIIAKVKRFIGKKEGLSKTLEQQKIFERIFLKYYLKGGTMENALEKTEDEFEEIGIGLKASTFKKRYLPRLKKKHGINKIEDLRNIF